VDGKGVYRIWYRGVEVAEAEEVLEPVMVVVAVIVTEEVLDPVGVEVTVGGSAVGLTEAISLPTVRSTPHTWGRDSVAE
jgi:hypothetical protein